MSYGEYPVIFTKPPDALAGPFEDIAVHPDCLNMDYEAEMCLVLGKDCKDLEADDVFEYILGYTAGNDVSSRYWQMPERSGNQHGSAKSFDKFAPIGPTITSTSVITNPAELRLESFVNGEKRQSTKTDDMIFDVPTILRHLSRGTTLRKGTVIMTGTPSGVAAFMKPPQWLKNGDVVEVSIDKIGSIKNKFLIEEP
ncbi:fumarylacetoacetate hydrolase family [Fusarium agapanthi]|uniref:Fumarylacetoacetate hydrolase family n=1 Tax=Fusarium agapanthi TaxID=1803897 RepID=A0A9P5E419_9HYPO|nr:fumarylacetoacetate hydrolase family [Fusarium agapanthi]